MTRLLAILAVVLAALPAAAENPPADQNHAKLTITTQSLGDTDQGVAVRITFRFVVPDDVPSGVPLAVVGTILHDATVVRNFRYLVPPSQRESVSAVQTMPPGESQIEARLMIPLEDQAPVLVGKTTQALTVAAVGKPYIASESEGAEGIIAEGIVPETSGSVKILAPRRDIAPNLFVVNVEVQPPVKRVEFWVEGKKILTRNAPPYRAELDLGSLPKRVEVRAVGYDARGKYVDEDAFVVNERETPLELKITRTETSDGVSHFKLSIQNPKNNEIQKVIFFVGQKKFREWTQPPFAVDIPTSALATVEYVRATATDSTNYEASDLLFLTGNRYSQEINVDIVELPVSVTDTAGNPITDLKQSDFQVFESGKPQKINAFNFAANLPISVGVLVDHSGSMKPRMKATREAAIEFFKRIIKSGDRAFIGGFAFDVTKLAPFVSDIGVLEMQVNAIPDAEGGTALYDAIVTGLYRFRTVQGRKALIVLTDGEDTTSRISYDDMLAYARSARVPLYFVGIAMGFTDISGTNKMKALAAETGGTAYFIGNVKQLDETYRKLEQDLRTQYLIAYNTETSKGDQKYRPVEVKVARPDAKVRTIRGFVP
ncbi:MAG: VWA domain-containing protein [Thermoanaerobaculia bacterium]